MAQALDAIVVGLGAMGSAATYQLAKRGAKVLGIDRYSPPHAQGSSHGDTRITRKAIGEGERYIPLALRSYEIFREVEVLTGRSLLTITGGLIISSRSPHAVSHVAGFFDNTVAAARTHGIAHELLDAARIRARFPAFKVRDDEMGYFEHDAGFLRPEECVAAQLDLAARHGARIQRDEKVERFEEKGGAVRVTTSRGEYVAKQLVVAAGPWIRELLAEERARHFTVTRQSNASSPGAFPSSSGNCRARHNRSTGFPRSMGRAEV
jgi:sarcosine oxidase